MRQYLELARTVLDEGTRKENRTGVDTLSYFGAFFRHDLQRGFPLLTTKKMHTRSIFTELCWFLKGLTNVKYLKDHKVSIWDEWADERGEVDAGYGQMWRAFPHHSTHQEGDGISTRFHDVHRPETFDQMRWAVERLKTHPMDRRIVISAWFPPKATQGRMAPCHYTFAFNVQNVKRWECSCGHVGTLQAACPACGSTLASSPTMRRELCLHWTQRSCDIALGVPFNIASYAALAHVIGREVGLPVGILAGSFIDFHIYTKKEDGSMADMDHVPGLVEQIGRDPLSLPTLRLIGTNPWDKTEPEDFVVHNYISHPAISFKVAV